jgi:branched-subunit amino acid transport protein
MDVSPLTLWLTIVGAGVGTFALRLSFIALLGRVEMPLFCRRVLRFVPAAVLTAFVIPLLFYENGALHVSIDNERLLAGLIAVIIGWRTKSILFTLVGAWQPCGHFRLLDTASDS